jgi:hypothetical protein
MDMKKILANFDSASRGEKSAPQGVADMKRFVSIIAESNNPYTPVEERTINSFDEGTIGGDANEFLLAADKIQDEVMAQVNKIKINADEALLRDMMDKFNNFMTAYHAVGKEIIQPDMFNDSMGEAKDLGASKKKETEFHTKLDKLVHKTFGKSPEEKKETKEGLSFKDYAALAEAKKKISASDDPCWKGYKMVGTKNKGGKEVPNCVPGKKGD